MPFNSLLFHQNGPKNHFASLETILRFPIPREGTPAELVGWWINVERKMIKSNKVSCFENIWLLLETIIGKYLFQINWPIKSRGSHPNAWIIISPMYTRTHLPYLSLSLSFLLFFPTYIFFSLLQHIYYISIYRSFITKPSFKSLIYIY